MAEPKRAPRAKRAPAAARSTRAARGGRDLYRLIARGELGRSQVTSVDTPVGRLSVGIANDEPFAVSDTCRHLFASLGGGRVTPEGCLECPWHHSQYDVTSGRMTRGPEGLAFLAVRELFKIYASYINPLRHYPVVEQNGVIYLKRSPR